MTLLTQWILFYVIPALAASALKRKELDVRIRATYVHLFVVVSIILLSLAGASIVWNVSVVTLSVLGIAVLLSVLLLGTLGLIYSASSAVQEGCLLLAGSFLAPATGLPVAAILTALPFSFTHRAEGQEWYWKPAVLFVWGVFSIYLYVLLQQPLVNVALHIIFGTILIHRNFLYTLRHNFPVRT